MAIELFIFLCGAALALTGSLTFWPVQAWYDFYIPIVLFIAGYLGGLFLIVWNVYWIAGKIISLKKNRDKPSRVARWMVMHGLRFMSLHALIKTELRGVNKLPKNEKFVLVCNHRSNYDPMIIIERFALKKIAFISKESNFKIPMVGRFMKGSCYQAIDREDREEALKIIRKCTKFVEDGIMSIGVFPEGTRQKKEIIGQFHEGVFNIAIHAGAPLVIAALKGTQNIAGRAPFKRTRVFLKIIGVIQPEELQNYTAKAVSDLSRDLMIDFLSE